VSGAPAEDRAETAACGLDPRLLALLVCPLTRQPLRWVPARRRLVSEAAGLAYPVIDGVPVLLVEEAEPWAAEAASGVASGRGPGAAR